MNKKKKIILIVSNGQSGSTLLDMVLGSANGGFSVGEVSNFNMNAKINEEKPVYCGCKSRISECDFYKSFNAFYIKRSNDSGIFDQSTNFNTKFIGHFLNKREQLQYFVSLKSSSDKLVVRNEKVLDNIELLYDYIFDNNNVDHIVDSHKGLFRSLSIYKRLNKKYDVRFVHLIRDQRAVAYSFCNKQSTRIEFESIDNTLESKVSFDAVRPFKYIPIEVMNTWMKLNLKTILALKLFFNKKYARIRHEDYTKNPEKELTKLCASLDLDYKLNPEKFELKNNHIISGSNAKFSARSINPANEKWRQYLDNETFKSYGLLQKMVNRLFGYK